MDEDELEQCDLCGGWFDVVSECEACGARVCLDCSTVEHYSLPATEDPNAVLPNAASFIYCRECAKKPQPFADEGPSL